MPGGHHHFALHQAARALFGIGQCLFHRHPVGQFQRAKDDVLLRCIKVFQNVDNVVRVQLTHGFRDHFARQGADHLFADRLVNFRQQLTVNFARPQR